MTLIADHNTPSKAVEAMAREFVEADLGHGLIDEHWQRWVANFHNPAVRKLARHQIMVNAFRHAEIAIRHVEAMREDAAKWHEQEALSLIECIDGTVYDDKKDLYREMADTHRGYAVNIRALPLPGTTP